MNPGQPHLEPVEEYAVRDSEMAKHLSFGDFEKPDIRTVIDNAGGVYVRPSDIFIDKKRFRFQVLQISGLGRRVDSGIDTGSTNQNTVGRPFYRGAPKRMSNRSPLSGANA